MDSFDEDRGDILVRTTDEEFTSTGLVKDTFLVNRDYARVFVPIANLFAVRSKVGFVSGEFKRRIEDFYGGQF